MDWGMSMKHRIAVAALAATVLLSSACSTRAPAPEPAHDSASPPLPSRLVEVLSGDGLFPFGKSSLEDFSPEGLQALDALVERLRQRPVAEINVIGHSDRIGNAEANRRLSLRRAEAVRDYLVAEGIDEDQLTVAGWGSESPLVDCEGERAQALVDCLAPNRRVELKIRFAPH